MSIYSDNELRVNARVFRSFEHCSERFAGTRCWKCDARNEVRDDLVQYDCWKCNATNYAKFGQIAGMERL